jgi:hypothetical protein
MTAFNIRKNTAAILKGAATVVENAKVPTKTQASNALHDIRCRAAALMMPNDMAFVITPKTNI